MVFISGRTSISWGILFLGLSYLWAFISEKFLFLGWHLFLVLCFERFFNFFVGLYFWEAFVSASFIIFISG